MCLLLIHQSIKKGASVSESDFIVSFNSPDQLENPEFDHLLGEPANSELALKICADTRGISQRG